MSIRDKHADKIIAKAENMGLVVFVNHGDTTNNNWLVTNDKHSAHFPIWDKDSDYFLCLDEHKEACLHWLNGGDVELLLDDVWGLVEDLHTRWSAGNIFMNRETSIRIKPKKEKRYIAMFPWGGNNEYVVPKTFMSIGELEKHVLHTYGKCIDPHHSARDSSQIIEIEVEV